MAGGGDTLPPAATTVGSPPLLLARQLVDFFLLVLREEGIDATQVQVSVAKVVEAVNFAGRDLRRIEHDLEHGASREKFAAYHAYWIARLKPITNARRPVDNGREEIVDINERLSILLAIALVSHGASEPSRDDVADYTPKGKRDVGYQSPPAPLVWRECRRRCTGQCFEEGVRVFLSHHDFQHFEYLVHSLRHRAVGPYAIVSFLDALVVASCYDLNGRVGTNLFAASP
ncbi:MAG TPA: hypothetical protein VF535_08490 [Allosphingosinicella sp.]|jgi:hypothetical protein